MCATKSLLEKDATKGNKGSCSGYCCSILAKYFLTAGVLGITWMYIGANEAGDTVA